jgi:hypothetical protein
MKQMSPIQEFRDRPSKKRSSDKPCNCQHEGCAVKLSIYNMTSYCSSHERLYNKLWQAI